jgi:hypothetical protein
MSTTEVEILVDSPLQVVAESEVTLKAIRREGANFPTQATPAQLFSNEEIITGTISFL